jgi:hypothetical protein
MGASPIMASGFSLNLVACILAGMITARRFKTSVLSFMGTFGRMKLPIWAKPMKKGANLSIFQTVMTCEVEAYWV